VGGALWQSSRQSLQVELHIQLGHSTFFALLWQQRDFVSSLREEYGKVAEIAIHSPVGFGIRVKDQDPFTFCALSHCIVDH